MTFSPLSSVQKQPNVAAKGPLVLNQGQVFRGTIQKLYPDNQAEIQIGEHRLIAKLETPLKAGDAHFFQVVSTQPETKLKVVTGPMVKGSSIEQLMESLHLPNSKEMKQLLVRFVKAQLPISKEQLLQAETYLKQLPEGMTKQEGLIALEKMIQLKAPLTKEVWDAFLFGTKTTGITDVLDQLTGLLKQTNAVPSALKTNVLDSLQAIKNPFEVETAGVVLSRLVQTVLQSEASIENKQQAFNLLKQLGIIPKTMNESEWLSSSYTQASQDGRLAGKIIHDMVQSNNMSQTLRQITEWIDQEPNLSAQQKENLTQMIQPFTNSSEKTAFIQKFTLELLKAYAEQVENQLFSKSSDAFSAKEQLLSLLKQDVQVETIPSTFAKMANVLETGDLYAGKQLAEAKEIIQSAINSKAIERGIQTILGRLGVSYEALLKNSQTTDEITQSLKPQLLSLLQDANTPAEIKHTSEMLLARLNGMQLLSGENGHQHQIIMQIPLAFLGKQVDATLEWNGKMEEDGKINADYARVLFYLNMENLKETVVDMQVQNRIVTIQVYNDNPQLAALAEPLKIALKKGLLEKNYQLSGVMMKPLEQKGQPKKNTETGTQVASKRVDIRI